TGYCLRIGSRMTRFSHLTLRNYLIAAHDVLATAFALFAAFYLRFEDGQAFYDRLPLLLRILPYFLLFGAVVCYVFSLTTTNRRFCTARQADLARGYDALGVQSRDASRSHSYARQAAWPDR